MKTLCGSCGEKFEAQRSTAKFCGDTCRKRARRSAQSRSEEAEPKKTVGGKRAKKPLVEAVRKELTKARRLDTVDGQIAMLLAEQTAVSTGSAAATLTKSLRAAVDRAIEGATPKSQSNAEAAPPEDEIDKARKKREQKARQAARRA